jgi:hypothetical protein
VGLTYTSGANEVAPEESTIDIEVPPNFVGRGSGVAPATLDARSVPYAVASEPGATPTAAAFAEDTMVACRLVGAGRVRKRNTLLS